MATVTDVNQVRASIDEVWKNPPARDGRWGNVLRSVQLDAVRGLSVTVELRWPVTAIGGTNGCGKTTVLQACSSAYVKRGTGKRHYTLGRWIGPALIGETPAIGPTAAVAFSFYDSTPTIRVPYQIDRKRWGYPRRGNPERDASFVGVAHFAPRIESQGRTHQNRARLNIEETTGLTERETESISRILGSPYDEASFHTVGIASAKWKDTVPQLRRGGYTYTESHMGAGEQKVVRLVSELEAIPNQSLVLLEEPELTLHPDAQFGLAWYLMTLARRKGHQIVIATHSPWIFEALPRDGRVLLARDRDGVSVLHNVTRLAAARELASSIKSNKDLILVEDAVAKRFLNEVLRRYARDLYRNAEVVDVGSADDVQRMVSRLRSQRVRAAGVRDADYGGDAPTGLFSLPGDAAPETLLIEEDNVMRAERHLGGLGDSAQRAQVQGAGYDGAERAKRVFRGICTELEESEDTVADRLTLTWLESNEEKAKSLVNALRRGLDSCPG